MIRLQTFTNALDDCDDNHEISIRGIEHFVFPVLQKEMVNKKKLLKRVVLDHEIHAIISNRKGTFRKQTVYISMPYINRNLGY